MDVYVLSYFIDSPNGHARAVIGVFRKRESAIWFASKHAGIDQAKLWPNENSDYSEKINTGLVGKGMAELYSIEMHPLS